MTPLDRVVFQINMLNGFLIKPLLHLSLCHGVSTLGSSTNTAYTLSRFYERPPPPVITPSTREQNNKPRSSLTWNELGLLRCFKFQLRTSI